MKIKLVFAGLLGFVVGLPCWPLTLLIIGRPGRGPATVNTETPQRQRALTTSEGMRSFSPPAPQFGDQPSHLTDSEMFVVIKNGIKNSGMGGWEVLLPDQDIWRVTTFLSRLGELPPPVDAKWKTGAPT
jgi:hypothetical protein